MSHQQRSTSTLAGPTWLLQTKLQIPVHPTVVMRPRLLQKLNAALEHTLTLISASAGFGKTTLVVDWLMHIHELAAQPVACAWVSLDEHDNDLRRFLSYLIAALQKIDNHIGRGLSEALQTPQQPDIEAMLTAVLNDLVALGEEQLSHHVLLVLDDYHVLDHPQIDEALIFLLEHLPARVHLVLLSRIDPALPLARLRAKRQIVEIRERDLRFTTDEASSFLSTIMHLTVSPPDVDVLSARTEGWIAGLQLAAIALQTADGTDATFIAEFSGTHRYIMDYLIDEVVQQQPAEIQRFLLETSLLNRMSAPLCDTLRASQDSMEILTKLEQLNLFIVPLDHQRRWYRYHHLFADLLRLRAQQTIPEELVALHERASTWYAELASSATDSVALDEAFHHALVAKNYHRVATLLEQWGDRFWESGEHDELRRLLATLPHDVRIAYPRLGIFQGWLAFTSGQYAEAETYLLQAEQMLGVISEAQELAGRIAATRAFIATFQGDAARTIRFAETALNLLGDQRSTWHGSAAIALGDAYGLSGTIATAGDAYQRALRTSQASGNTYLALNAGFKLAATQRQRGMLQQAFSTCSELIDVAEQHGLAQTAMAGCLYALRGDILCEWNRLPEALAETQRGINVSAYTKHLGFAGWIHLYRTRCLLAARDIEQAEATIQRIETLAQPTLPPWLASPFAALRVLLLLVRGNIGGANAWVAERGLGVQDTILPMREFEYLTFARILALQGRLPEAQTLLAQLLESSRMGGRTSVSIIVLITQALLLQAQGKRDDAVAAIVEALGLAEPGNFTRVFVDSGAPLVPLLKAAEARGTTPLYVRSLLNAFAPATKWPRPANFQIPSASANRMCCA
jgi:LuxR family maltose regulon positive regulatory protein